MRSSLKNITLFTLSLFVFLLLAEFLVRLIVDPVDYLRAEPVADKFLGHKLMPGQSGHDELGFRNSSIPEKIEILCIGDSQTYGVNASGKKSWPAQLCGLSKKQVYNMSLGGYGPLEYLFLLQEQVEQLNPKQLIIGLYSGNDLVDAYRSVYGLDHYGDLRLNYFDSIEQRGDSKAIYNREEIKDPLFKSARTYFANHSVLYRMLSYSALARKAKGKSEVNGGCWLGGNEPTQLLPKLRNSTQDLSDEKVSEGLRLTKIALSRINGISVDLGISLRVMIIPTKEYVYGDLLIDEKINCESLEDCLKSEGEIRRELLTFLESENITIIDPLPALKESRDKVIYPPTDGHPYSLGYSLIANAALNGIN